jgi:hypothetical protein
VSEELSQPFAISHSISSLRQQLLTNLQSLPRSRNLQWPVCATDNGSTSMETLSVRISSHCCDVSLANTSPPADPDLSNPTRRRTERPLETIRSFEAAIDTEYNRKRRESVMLRPGGYPRTPVCITAQKLTATTETSGPDHDYSSRRTSTHWGK